MGMLSQKLSRQPGTFRAANPNARFNPAPLTGQYIPAETNYSAPQATTIGSPPAPQAGGFGRNIGNLIPSITTAGQFGSQNRLPEGITSRGYSDGRPDGYAIYDGSPLQGFGIGDFESRTSWRPDSGLGVPDQLSAYRDAFVRSNAGKYGVGGTYGGLPQYNEPPGSPTGRRFSPSGDTNLGNSQQVLDANKTRSGTFSNVVDTVGNIANIAAPFIENKFRGDAASSSAQNFNAGIGRGIDTIEGYTDKGVNAVNDIYGQTQRNLQPYLDAGAGALDEYGNQLRNPRQFGLPDYNQTQLYDRFRQSGNAALPGNFGFDISQIGESDFYKKFQTENLEAVNRAQGALGNFGGTGQAALQDRQAAIFFPEVQNEFNRQLTGYQQDVDLAERQFGRDSQEYQFAQGRYLDAQQAESTRFNAEKMLSDTRFNRNESHLDRLNNLQAQGAQVGTNLGTIGGTTGATLADIYGKAGRNIAELNTYAGLASAQREAIQGQGTAGLIESVTGLLGKGGSIIDIARQLGVPVPTIQDIASKIGIGGAAAGIGSGAVSALPAAGGGLSLASPAAGGAGVNTGVNLGNAALSGNAGTGAGFNLGTAGIATPDVLGAGSIAAGLPASTGLSLASPAAGGSGVTGGVNLGNAALSGNAGTAPGFSLATPGIEGAAAGGASGAGGAIGGSGLTGAGFAAGGAAVLGLIALSQSSPHKFKDAVSQYSKGASFKQGSSRRTNATWKDGQPTFKNGLMGATAFNAAMQAIENGDLDPRDKDFQAFINGPEFNSKRHYFKGVYGNEASRDTLRDKVTGLAQASDDDSVQAEYTRTRAFLEKMRNL